MEESQWTGENGLIDFSYDWCCYEPYNDISKCLDFKTAKFYWKTGRRHLLQQYTIAYAKDIVFFGLIANVGSDTFGQNCI